MSSIVHSGKSARISASVMLDARYSKTSDTVIRSPRTQGFPLRLPAFIEEGLLYPRAAWRGLRGDAKPVPPWELRASKRVRRS
jgi:hypothetical protein